MSHSSGSRDLSGRSVEGLLQFLVTSLTGVGVAGSVAVGP